VPAAESSGCIAALGGLEVASDRLKLIDKGTVEQAKVTQISRRHYGAFVFDVWLPNTNGSGNSRQS
jgi:hypothetical protein